MRLHNSGEVVLVSFLCNWGLRLTFGLSRDCHCVGFESICCWAVWLFLRCGSSFLLFCKLLEASGAVCATLAMLFRLVLWSILFGAGWLASCWNSLSVCFVSIWRLRVASAHSWRGCFGWFCNHLGPPVCLPDSLPPWERIANHFALID